MATDVSTDRDPSDEPPVRCRHFLICRSFNESDDWDSGGDLIRLVVALRPAEDQPGPFHVRRLFAYFQLHGDPGLYSAVVRIVSGGGGAQEFGPCVVEVTGLCPVDCICLMLRSVSCPTTGAYEFQLWLDDMPEPVAREVVWVYDEEREEP